MSPFALFHNSGHGIDAPFGGTFVLTQERSAFLVLAGYPSKQGTPRPVRVDVIATSDAAPTIQDVLRDIFWLSQLNWNTPEIDINLPLTLRFTDQKLERYTIQETGEGADEDDWGDKRPS